MATNEPMTTERIYEIDALWVFLDETEVDEARDALRELLIEVRRLRAREQALAADITAMRPVVEAVAAGAEYASNLRDMFHCLWCDGEDVEQRDVQHDNNCFVTQARAFVATHPTSTAAGEAESEGE